MFKQISGLRIFRQIEQNVADRRHTHTNQAFSLQARVAKIHDIIKAEFDGYSSQQKVNEDSRAKLLKGVHRFNEQLQQVAAKLDLYLLTLPA